MILSEYQAKREDLEKKMQEIGHRQAEHMMELSINNQKLIRDINSQIGNLKKKRQEAMKEYQKDVSWYREKYKQEKRKVQISMHLLRMEYLTVSGEKGGES